MGGRPRSSTEPAGAVRLDARRTALRPHGERSHRMASGGYRMNRPRLQIDRPLPLQIRAALVELLADALVADYRRRRGTGGRRTGDGGAPAQYGESSPGFEAVHPDEGLDI